jgi:hypothetical protein
VLVSVRELPLVPGSLSSFAFIRIDSESRQAISGVPMSASSAHVGSTEGDASYLPQTLPSVKEYPDIS